MIRSQLQRVCASVYASFFTSRATRGQQIATFCNTRLQPLKFQQLSHRVLTLLYPLITPDPIIIKAAATAFGKHLPARQPNPTTSCLPQQPLKFPHSHPEPSRADLTKTNPCSRRDPTPYHIPWYSFFFYFFWQLLCWLSMRL